MAFYGSMDTGKLSECSLTSLQMMVSLICAEERELLPGMLWLVWMVGQQC